MINTKKCPFCKGQVYYFDDETEQQIDAVQCGDCSELFGRTTGEHLLYSHTLKKYIIDPATKIPKFMRL